MTDHGSLQPQEGASASSVQEDKPASYFPNLASDPTPERISEVNAICKAELEAAGIMTHTFGAISVGGEVPTRCMGHLSGWSFRRSWRYWVAEGPGVPPDIAERLHAGHGYDVRVDGHCAAPSPLEWRNGFAIGLYHIDTAPGLKALADTLASIWDDRPAATVSGDADASTAGISALAEMDQASRALGEQA